MNEINFHILAWIDIPFQIGTENSFFLRFGKLKKAVFGNNSIIIDRKPISNGNYFHNLLHIIQRIKIINKINS